MKSLLFILLPCMLSVAFTALPTANAFACGDSPIQNCCNKNETENATGCCNSQTDCSNPSDQNEDGCGGNCGKNGCPCPTTSSTNSPAALLAAAELQIFDIFIGGIFTKSDWYFAAKIPKSVWLSVWLPPKIDC